MDKSLVWNSGLSKEFMRDPLDHSYVDVHCWFTFMTNPSRLARICCMSDVSLHGPLGITHGILITINLE